MSNEKIYSYIERKMIDPANYQPDFKNKEKSSLTVGGLLKRIFLIGIIIFIGFHLFPYLKTSSPEYTKSFLDSVSDISADSNSIVTKIVSQYNSNNFSASYKQELQNDIKSLQKYSLNKGSNDKFNDLRQNTLNIINKTQDITNLIISSKVQSNELSNSLNSKIATLNSDIYNNKTLLIKYFEDNNIPYQIDDANNRIHYQITTNRFLLF